MLLELSSLNEPWSIDSLSGATLSYIAERHPAPVAVHDVDWFALADLCFEFECCFQIGRGPVVKCLGLLKYMTWFYTH